MMRFLSFHTSSSVLPFSKKVNPSSSFALIQVLGKRNSSSNSSPIENVMILGSGLMGSGIAQSCAQSKFIFKSIVLQDVQQKALDNARNKIYSNLNRLKKKNSSINEEEILSKITFSQQMEPKNTNNLLIIEAVPEKLELKQNIFKQLSNQFGNDESVILATNTSSLPCSDIGVKVKNQANFGGLHFFNPVPIMKLVEVIRTDGTSEETFNRLVQFVHNLGKTPVRCKDTPGFIVNRLLLPYMMQALELVERGDATPEDVDIAMKLGAGYPMGPFELMDFVGLDTVKFITDGWVANGASFIKASATIDKLVNEGRLGKKTGSGFYEYTK